MFQNSLFDATKRVNIVVRERHDLVRLASLIDWRALILIVMNIRQSKIVKDSGPKPHYRQLLGAIALMAVKNLTYREAEDQIAHYAPANASGNCAVKPGAYDVCFDHKDWSTDGLTSAKASCLDSTWGAVGTWTDGSLCTAGTLGTCAIASGSDVITMNTNVVAAGDTAEQHCTTTMKGTWTAASLR